MELQVLHPRLNFIIGVNGATSAFVRGFPEPPFYLVLCVQFLSVCLSFCLSETSPVNLNFIVMVTRLLHVKFQLINVQQGNIF